MVPMQDHISASTCLPSAALTLSSAFSADPVLRWLLTQHPKAYSLIENPLFVERFFLGLVTLSLSGKSVVTEVSLPPDSSSSAPEIIPHFPSKSIKGSESPVTLWPCIGVFAPPGVSAGKGSLSANIEVRRHIWHFLSVAKLSTSWRISHTLPSIQKSLKKTVFAHPKAKGLEKRVKKEGWYYIFFLGTVPECRRNGLGSDFVRKVQQHALEHTERDKQGEKVKKPKCVYLETSTPDAKRLYEKCGFDCLGELRLGEGRVDEDGYVDGNKEKTGVRFWGMLWRPE